MRSRRVGTPFAVLQPAFDALFEQPQRVLRSESQLWTLDQTPDLFAHICAKALFVTLVTGEEIIS